MLTQGRAEADPKHNLLRAMTANSNDDVVERVICFANNDVPEYLENLRKFNEESRKVEITVQ